MIKIKSKYIFISNLNEKMGDKMKKVVCIILIATLFITIISYKRNNEPNSSSGVVSSDSSQNSEYNSSDNPDSPNSSNSSTISTENSSVLDSSNLVSSDMGNSQTNESNVNTSKFSSKMLEIFNLGYISKNAAAMLDSNKAIPREALADICGKILAVKSNNIPMDVSSTIWYAQGVGASQLYNLFGSNIEGFKFNTNKFISRIDAARLSIRLYAAIMGIEDYQVEPGVPNNITDLGSISVEKKWFIYSSLTKGFLNPIQTGKFMGTNYLTANDAALMILSVIKAVKLNNRPVRAATANEKKSNFKMFPSLKSGVSSSIDTINITAVGSRGRRLATTSLQGLVNRDETKIFVSQGRDWNWMLDFYIQEGYTSSIGKAFEGDLEGMITKYKKYIKGAVVYDSKKLFTINVANDIAAVEDRIIIDSTMITKIKELGISNIKDLTGKFPNMYEAAKWSYENNWPFMRRDAISWTAYYTSTDYNRDYTTQMKIPTIWGASTAEDTSASDTNLFIRDQLSKLPANIPILGFQYSVEPRGAQIGWNEYNGVKICGVYGKYTNVSDWSGNYSFQTRVPVSSSGRKFVSKNTTTPTFNINKKYIAVTMIESGDAPGYIQYGLKPRQWDDKKRGQVAFNISYGLCNYELLPGLTQYFFKTAKANDYFFGAISGLGYMYPLEGYGSAELFDDDGQVISDKDTVINDYYSKTAIMLDRLGFTSMGLYSHPGAFWTQKDYDLVKNYVLPNIPKLTSIFADMGRVTNLTGKATTVNLSNKVPLFHCISFWTSTSLGNSYETANDSEAAKFLADEIEKNVNSGNFFHAMAYSWMYSARRIELAKIELNRRHPGTYEFITIDQMERMYQSNK